MTRFISFAGVAIVGITLMWALPVIGLVAVAALLVVLPPWGRTFSERAVISGIVLLGGVAVLFPRAGNTTIDVNTARIFLAALLILCVSLYAIPQLRKTPLPKPRPIELVFLAVAGGLFYWLVSSYLGVTSDQLLSGL